MMSNRSNPATPRTVSTISTSSSSSSFMSTFSPSTTAPSPPLPHHPHPHPHPHSVPQPVPHHQPAPRRFAPSAPQTPSHPHNQSHSHHPHHLLHQQQPHSPHPHSQHQAQQLPMLLQSHHPSSSSSTQLPESDEMSFTGVPYSFTKLLKSVCLQQSQLSTSLLALRSQVDSLKNQNFLPLAAGASAIVAAPALDVGTGTGAISPAAPTALALAKELFALKQSLSSIDQNLSSRISSLSTSFSTSSSSLSSFSSSSTSFQNTTLHRLEKLENVIEQVNNESKERATIAAKMGERLMIEMEEGRKRWEGIEEWKREVERGMSKMRYDLQMMKGGGGGGGGGGVSGGGGNRTEETKAPTSFSDVISSYEHDYYHQQQSQPSQERSNLSTPIIIHPPQSESAVTDNKFNNTNTVVVVLPSSSRASASTTSSSSSSSSSNSPRPPPVSGKDSLCGTSSLLTPPVTHSAIFSSSTVTEQQQEVFELIDSFRSLFRNEIDSLRSQFTSVRRYQIEEQYKLKLNWEKIKEKQENSTALCMNQIQNIEKIYTTKMENIEKSVEEMKKKLKKDGEMNRMREDELEKKYGERNAEIRYNFAVMMERIEKLNKGKLELTELAEAQKQHQHQQQQKLPTQSATTTTTTTTSNLLSEVSSSIGHQPSVTAFHASELVRLSHLIDELRTEFRHQLKALHQSMKSSAAELLAEMSASSSIRHHPPPPKEVVAVVAGGAAGTSTSGQMKGKRAMKGRLESAVRAADLMAREEKEEKDGEEGNGANGSGLVIAAAGMRTRIRGTSTNSVGRLLKQSTDISNNVIQDRDRDSASVTTDAVPDPMPASSLSTLFGLHVLKQPVSARIGRTPIPSFNTIPVSSAEPGLVPSSLADASASDPHVVGALSTVSDVASSVQLEPQTVGSAETALQKEPPDFFINTDADLDAKPEVTEAAVDEKANGNINNHDEAVIILGEHQGGSMDTLSAPDLPLDDGSVAIGKSVTEP